MTMILAVLVAWSVAGCGTDDRMATAATVTAPTGDAAIADAGVPDPPGDEPGERRSGPDLSVLGQGSLEGRDLVIWFWAGY